MLDTNDELRKLNNQKHSLIRQYERKEVDKETYKKEFKDLQKQIDEKTRIRIDELNIAQKEKENERRKELEQREIKINKLAEALNMTEEKNVDKKKTIGRKPKGNSNASLIAKALEMKSIKDIDGVVDKVISEKPDVDKKKIKLQAKTIIREVKAGKGRWKDYTWDEGNFLLIKKE